MPIRPISPNTLTPIQQALAQQGKAPRPLGKHPGPPKTKKAARPLGDVSNGNIMDRITSQIAQSGGLARQNRYEVFIPTLLIKNKSTEIYTDQLNALQFTDDATDWMTDYFDADIGEIGKSLSAYCEKAELPSYQFQMENVHTYGPAFKIPHAAEYQDITLTFLCGNNMLERFFFDSWMHMVMDPLTNNFNYIDEYAVDMKIVQYKENYEEDQEGAFIPVNYAVTLVQAFPIAINAQDLAYDANDSIQKVQVTFTYKYALPKFSPLFANKGNINSKSRRGELEQLRLTVR